MRGSRVCVCGTWSGAQLRGPLLYVISLRPEFPSILPRDQSQCIVQERYDLDTLIKCAYLQGQALPADL